MGLVHFLHGKLPSLKISDKPSIICPNEKCHQKIEKATTLNGKKVCPQCKTAIPASMLKKLEKK